MKRPAVSERDQRTIAIAALVIIVGVGYVKGIKPYQQAYADATTQLADNRLTLAKEKASVAASTKNPMLQHIADSAMDAMGLRLFRGQDAVAASADLEAYLKILARESHVYISQSRTQATTTLPTGIQMLRLNISALSDLQGIVAFLDSLDHGDHLVCVEHMQLAVLSSVDTSKGVQEIGMTATIDGYQIPSAIRPPPGRSGPAPLLPGAVGAPVVGVGPQAAPGRAAAAPTGIPCDPSPPAAVLAAPAKKVGQ